MSESISRLLFVALLTMCASGALAAVTSSVGGGALSVQSDGADTISVSCSSGSVLVNGANPGTGAAACNAIQTITVVGGPGTNVISLATITSGDFPVLTTVSLSGGAGSDILVGSTRADQISGGDGIDLVDGNEGSDTVTLGPGDDTFIWNPGDGNDTVDGDAGNDLLRFNGSAGAEIFALSPSGSRALLNRNIGSIQMNLGTIEDVRINALGSTDSLTMAAMTGTDVVQVTFDLAPTINGTAGDAAADVVTVNGSAGPDSINVSGSGTQVAVEVGATTLTIANSEFANDDLVLNGLGGNDSISGTLLPSGVIGLTIDGGANDDDIAGGQGADVLLGGDGNDTVTPDNGNDTVLLGAGNDRSIWNPGDGSDVIEGQAGEDTLQFNGSNASENIQFLPSGGRLSLFRDIGAITMDLDDVETIDIAVLGGADNLTIADLSGTDVSSIAVALTASGGSGDGAIDTVTLNGSTAADAFGLTGVPGDVAVARGTFTLAVSDAEPALDRLIVNALDGADTFEAATSASGAFETLTFDGGTGIDAAHAQGGAGVDAFTIMANGSMVDVLLGGSARLFSAIAENTTINGADGNDSTTTIGNLAALTALTIDGGSGHDTLLGGNGADVILGGDGDDTVDGQLGNDTVLLGSGNDDFIWDPGDGSDVVEGQGDSDALHFNGSAGNEIFTLSPNGVRAVLARNIGNILMDLNEVEEVRIAALGGADSITVTDLTGTDVNQTRIDLSVAGSGDGQIDAVNVEGTTAGDAFTLLPDGNGMELTRLASSVAVVGAETANDTLTITALGGDDVLVAAVGGLTTMRRVVFEAGTHGGLGDQLIVNGDAIAETFTITPDANRTIVTHAAGGVLDANEIERLQLAVAGGADTVNTQGLATVAQIIDGGAPASFPGDVLMVSGFAGDSSVSPIQVPGAQPITHAGFEFGPTGGRVRGKTFDDTDRDGLLDAGESALAGLTVFDDANGNRIVDGGETFAVTAGDGGYELAFPDQGSSADLRAIAPAGRVQTTEPPATIVLNDDVTVSNIDLGFTPGRVIEAFPSGRQETPPNGSPATGYGHAALYEPSNQAVFTLTYSGLGSANTLTHVHGPARRGVAAPPIIDLPASAVTSGSLRVGPVALTADQATQLKSGLWYFNVHTTNFPNGEIRGQLDNSLFRDSFE